MGWLVKPIYNKVCRVAHLIFFSAHLFLTGKLYAKYVQSVCLFLLLCINGFQRRGTNVAFKGRYGFHNLSPSHEHLHRFGVVMVEKQAFPKV